MRPKGRSTRFHQGPREIRVTRAILGPPGEESCTQRLSLLPRLVTRADEGIEWEADPRHVQIRVEQLDVTGAKITTPMVEENAEEIEAEGESELLEPPEATMYESCTMRANYIGIDRPDIKVATKELVRGMSKPTQRNLVSLRRLAR